MCSLICPLRADYQAFLQSLLLVSVYKCCKQKGKQIITLVFEINLVRVVMVKVRQTRLLVNSSFPQV